jgi:hypothetical protein
MPNSKIKTTALKNHYLVTFTFSQRGHIAEYRESRVFLHTSRKGLWNALCKLHDIKSKFTPYLSTYLTQFLPDLEVEHDHKKLQLFSYDFGKYNAADSYDYGTFIIIDIEEINVVEIEI